MNYFKRHWLQLGQLKKKNLLLSCRNLAQNYIILKFKSKLITNISKNDLLFYFISKPKLYIIDQHSCFAFIKIVLNKMLELNIIL